MEFDNVFEVPLPPKDAWRVLMDIPRIAPCMPGAELDEQVDDHTFKGNVAVRLGPVALSFAGTARLEAVDEADRSARMKASGNDRKGRGGANATATFRIEEVLAGSRVLVHTNLMLSGSVAQYGRGAGMIQDVAGQLVKQFATNLRDLIEVETPASAAEPADAPPAPPPAAKPIGGLSLVFGALWRAVLRLFGGRSAA